MIKKPYNHRMGFQKGHLSFATPDSEKRRVKNFLTSVRRGEDSPNWKGEKASFISKHEWARKQIPEPKVCPDCGKKKRLDITNKDHKYRRVLSDWKYRCRSCHNKYDIKYNGRPKPPKKARVEPVSNCCQAMIIENSDVCSACKEHCAPEYI